jgi:hexosaminidase
MSLTMRRLSLLGVLGLLLSACHTPRHEPDAVAPLSLIPAPVSVEQTPGHFEVRQGMLLRVRSDNAEALSIARYFDDLMTRSRGLHLDLHPAAASDADGAIEFALDPDFSTGDDDRGEGYRLAVEAHRITLVARTPHGLFNGSVTLWQLMTLNPAPAHGIQVPTLRVVDYPRFAWRGLLLDSARHFQPPEFVKRFIDEMALHKLNVLHWHLTDDQGWRVEIKRYPKLTDIGAWREPQPDEATLVDPATGKYGGFYTQEQIRDIVRHAAERYVTIVPEIDMPGHAQAAIASYPELGVTGRQPLVSSDWGINTYIYNVDESTFTFIDNVLAEVVALFPSPYIHVGGDEAAKDQWQASPHVQERMRRLGVRDEQALQGYFTARLEGFLHRHQRRLIGWDEILEGGLPPGAVVMSWRGAEGALAAARHGDDVVMSPDPTMYLDHLQSTAPQEPPGRVKVLSLGDVYAFDPIPKELTPEQARHVLGAQANLWSEYLTTPERVEYAAFPRSAALAERLWSPGTRASWNDFVARLPAQLERYRSLGVNFSDSAFVPQIIVSATTPGLQMVTIQRQLEAGAIRYALDGSAPTSSSPIYREPFTVKAAVPLQAAVFDGKQRLSNAIGERIDRSSALRRYSDRLKSCGDSLLLRLEGALGTNVPAPRYNVDLMNPCWIYPQVDFDAIERIDVRVGALPYFFQLWHDTDKVVTHAPGGTADELQLRLDSCDGALLAAVPLSEARNDTRTAGVPIGAQKGLHDVCLYFATHARDPLRLIDWVEPIPHNH